MNRKLAWITVTFVLAAAVAAVPALVHGPPATREFHTTAVSSGAREATVSASGTLSQTAHDLTRMQVETRVAAADIGRVRAGQSVRFTVDAYPRETFRGTVDQVRLPSATAAGMVTCTVVIRAHNESLRLRPGMTADVEILVATRGRARHVRNAHPRVSRTDPGGAVAAAAPSGGFGPPPGPGGQRA